MSLRISRSFPFAAILHLAATSAMAAAFHVNSTLDKPDADIGDGVCQTAANTCTLRAAVMQANVVPGSTTIHLPAGTYTLTRLPIGDNGADTGDLNFASTAGAITLIGAGAESTIIDGNLLDRVIRIQSNLPVTLSYVTIRNGSAVEGAGVYMSSGLATLYRVTIRDNRAQIDGGGVAAVDGPNQKILESTIRDNHAGIRGGGIFARSGATVEASTISGNSANGGGGVFVAVPADLRIVQSTISSNRAEHDGAGVLVMGGATANVYSSTIVFNMADSDDDGKGDAGGLMNYWGGTVNVRNCLIAGNYIVNFFDWDDCVGTIGSYGHNLFWDVAGCSIGGPGGSDLLNDLGTIGPLAKNGSATQTHALLPGSNAIDGGDPVNGCLSPTGTFATDQRGVPRVNGARCDVGAYEAGILFADGFEIGDLSAWPSAWSG